MGDADSSHALLTLIGSIYDCALEPKHWDKTFSKIGEALDKQVALNLSGVRHDRWVIAKAVGGTSNWIEQPQGHISEREIDLGGLLLPHLSRTFTICDVLDASRMKCALMAEALDVLRCGVVLTDKNATILHANRSAEEMLRDARFIQRKHGVLTANVPDAARELHHAIQLATRSETQLGKAGLAIRLTDPEAPSALAHVLPMIGRADRTRWRPTGAAVVFVVAPSDEYGSAGTMAAVYSLTPAETRVLASLLAGRTLTETGGFLNIAVTTAKTHLKNIFSKTGVTRQAELMLLAAHISSPGRSAS